MQLFGLDNTVLNMDPETVPFRLARILTNAIEVSGIKGTYRITCENLKGVLRDNKETLMAVLEAFVYDPLINWRLLQLEVAPASYYQKKTSDSTPSSFGADWNGRPFFSICSTRNRVK
jgi:FKBP12-rapamycin complex-associated protein